MCRTMIKRFSVILINFKGVNTGKLIYEMSSIDTISMIIWTFDRQDEA